MRLRLAAACVAATLLIAGCGDDDPDASDPDDPTTSGPASPSEDPTTPSVPPATGKLIPAPPGSFRAPAGWTVTDESVGDLVSASTAARPDSASSVYVSVIDDVDDPLDALEQESLDSLKEMSEKVRAAGRLEIAGHPAYHLVGTSVVDRRDVYGFVVDGRWITLDFSHFDQELQPDQEVIDSVLASWAP